MKVEAKWNSAAQGRFVTRAMRAFRKPVARVKIPTKPPNDMRGTTKSAFGPKSQKLRGRKEHNTLGTE